MWVILETEITKHIWTFLYLKTVNTLLFTLCKLLSWSFNWFTCSASSNTFNSAVPQRPRCLAETQSCSCYCGGSANSVLPLLWVAVRAGRENLPCCSLSFCPAQRKESIWRVLSTGESMRRQAGGGGSACQNFGKHDPQPSNTLSSAAIQSPGGSK